MREMKYSGVEWIGDIPEEWDIRKIASVVPIVTDFVASGSFADLRNNVKYLDSPDYAMLVRTADLSGTRDNIVYIDKHAYDFLSNSNLFGGEIILSNIGSVGNVFQYKPMYERSSLAPNAIMLNGTECNRYLYYWFLSPIANEELKRIGSHAVQLKFNKTQLKQMAIVYPPLPEQQAIADILDRKCTQIDALIANEEQQIAKLKAYKQSVITETVTKGLNPDVPMKDSGNDYICQIPIHWKAIKIKYLCTMQAGKNLISEQIAESGTYPVYGGNGIRGFFSEPNYKGECLLVGRQGALCGNVHYVSGEFWATEHAVITEPKKEVSIKYLFYLLTGVNLNLYVSPTAAQPGLSVNTVQNVIVCLAPIDEQQQIADYLDQKCEQIDRLIAIKQQKIEKLQQYKKSVIYEYVTGKREVE